MRTALEIHTAVRRYCIEQHAFWAEKYREFPAGGPYSQAAYGIFPRYRLAQETLVNVERAVFYQSTDLRSAQDVLCVAGQTAFQVLSGPMKGQNAAVRALEDQLSSYLTFIESVDSLSDGQVEPLPFRRVLSDQEVQVLWQRLRSWWGIQGAGYGWFPLSDDAQPFGSLTFHEELWDARQGGAMFQRFLSGQNALRCFMLRELGPPDYELDRELARPVYDGSETFLFTDSTWVIYASHESSLTLAGSVAAFFRDQWGDADNLAYGGPFHTDDLRGTWNW